MVRYLECIHEVYAFLCLLVNKRKYCFREEMKRTTITLIVSGLKLCPLAHLVTYGLIPVVNRLLWVDLIEIIRVTILATSAAGGEKDGEEQKSIH